MATDHTAQTPQARLIAKWRGFASDPLLMPDGFDLNPQDVLTWFNGRNAAYRAAADDLETILRQSEAAPAGKWHDKDSGQPGRIVRVVHVSDDKVSYRNEASGRLTVTRKSTFFRMFEPVEEAPRQSEAPPPASAIQASEGTPPAVAEADALTAVIHQLRKHQASHQSWLDHFRVDPNHTCGRCTPEVLAGVGDAVEQEVSVKVYDGLIERVTAAQNKLRALAALTGASEAPPTQEEQS